MIMSLGLIFLIMLLMLGIMTVVIIVMFANKKKKVIETYNNQLMLLRSKGLQVEKYYTRRITVASQGDVEYKYLIFDFTHNLCAYEFELFSMGDITAVQLINDSTVVQSSSSSMGGGALLGVVVPGVAGFGGQSSSNSGEQSAVVAVRVPLNNPRTPSFMIPFLFAVVPKASPSYQQAVQVAYEVYGIFEMALKRNEQAANAPKPQAVPGGSYCTKCGASNTPGAKFCSACGNTITVISEKTKEQILKLEQLRDDGILSVQEFEDKKKMLMDQTGQ